MQNSRVDRIASVGQYRVVEKRKERSRASYPMAVGFFLATALEQHIAGAENVYQEMDL